MDDFSAEDAVEIHCLSLFYLLIDFGILDDEEFMRIMDNAYGYFI